MEIVKRIRNNPNIFILSAAAFAILFAYISQYVFGYEPCVLCLHQRKPFFIIIAAVIAGLFFFKSKKSQNIIFAASIILLFINAAIASYHVGVERKIFTGPTACASNNLNDFTDLNELIKAIEKTKAINCAEPEFFLLGLSMASWNLIYCLFLAITFLLIARGGNSYERNRREER